MDSPRISKLAQILGDQGTLLAYEEGRGSFLSALQRLVRAGGPDLAVGAAVARVALDDLQRTDDDRRRWFNDSRDDERTMARRDLNEAARVRRVLRAWLGETERELRRLADEERRRNERVARATAALERQDASGARLALGLLRGGA